MTYSRSHRPVADLLQSSPLLGFADCLALVPTSRLLSAFKKKTGFVADVEQGVLADCGITRHTIYPALEANPESVERCSVKFKTVEAGNSYYSTYR